MSYTEFEFNLARKYDIPRYILVADPNGEWKVSSIDKDRNRLEAFRETIREEVSPSHFLDFSNFCISLGQALIKTLRKCRGYILASDPNAKDDHDGVSATLLLEIAYAIRQDINARNTVLTGGDVREHEWCVKEISRCNLGQRYVRREDAARHFSDWLVHQQKGCFLITGPSGTGKTNFLIHELDCFITEDIRGGKGKERFVTITPLFFPLGIFQREHSLWENLALYLKDRLKTPETPIVESELKQLADQIEELVRNGNVLLILDGLDEFARQHGEEKSRSLVGRIAGIEAQSRVVLSCRDHIYDRLKRKGVFAAGFKQFELGILTDKELDHALKLESRTVPSHLAHDLLRKSTALRQLAKHPLLLEMLSRISPWDLSRLGRKPCEANIYDLWFEETCRLSQRDLPDLAGKAARMMLDSRSDLLHRKQLDSQGLAPEAFLPSNEEGMPVFIQQTPDEWGFVHDSFREYWLAKMIQREVFSNEPALLKETASLDYLGAETFRFLHELLPPNQQLLEKVVELIRAQSDLTDNEWNNVVQNCFEAIGMMADSAADGGYVDLALKYLPDNRLTNRTKYNIVRFLERAHSSAPRPYWRHMLTTPWPTKPNNNCYGAAAVRGFHKTQPRIGYDTPIHFMEQYNRCEENQKPVSEALVSLMRQVDVESANGSFLTVNCSLALMRWLHTNQLKQLCELCSHLGPEAKGNVFLACMRLEPETRKKALKGKGKCFDGMLLHFVDPNVCELDIQDFMIENVTFLETGDWAFPELNDYGIFTKPARLLMKHYKRSFVHADENEAPNGKTRK
ncbi:MAG: NACHT domain-containing protein [Planctomycetes bacterium]|nr:NACHT domain-containing protein [Planctomycetota bacterium]